MTKQLPDLKRSIPLSKRVVWWYQGREGTRAARQIFCLLPSDYHFWRQASLGDGHRSGPSEDCYTGVGTEARPVWAQAGMVSWWGLFPAQGSFATEALLTGFLSTAGLNENANHKQNKTKKPRLNVCILLEDYNF